MNNDLESIKQKVEELIAVPHCYGELKECGKNWLDSIGTAEEKDAAKKLVAELEEDVLSIDDLINFAKSKDAVEKFGAEIAGKILSDAEVAKENGEKYCTCAACKAGAAVLELKDLLLN